jgi:hypothetical protein
LNRSAASRFLGALITALFVFFLHLPQTQDSILFDDAADYMRAAQAPIVSTWLNTNSATPLELMHRRKSDPDFNLHPWFTAYTEGDNAALRHFHTPISFYMLHVVRGFFSSDRCARVLWSAAGALLCGLFYFILAESSLPLFMVALLTFFVAVQASLIETSVDPTPHIWFIPFALGFLFLFSRYLTSHRPRDLYLAAVLLALAFATLEFSLELFAAIPVALVILWITRRKELPAFSSALKSTLKACAVFLVTTFVIWPGGWLRGGYVECYGILSAYVLHRNTVAHPHPHRFPVNFLNKAWAGHASVWILVSIGILAALWLLFRKRLSIPSVVFSSCAVFAFGLGVADHFLLNTYFFESAVMLLAAVGFILGDLFSDLKKAEEAPSRMPGWGRPILIGLIACLMVVGSALECSPAHRADLWSTRAWLGDVVTGVRQIVPVGATVMTANNREAFSLYLPEYHIVYSPDYHSQPEDIQLFLSKNSLWRPGEKHYGIGIQRAAIPANAEILRVFPTFAQYTELLWRAQ